MVLFDELGLAERSETNPLKVLHSKLEYAGKEKGVSFVGISNYSLDAAKINRALVLSVPDLDLKLDDLIKTSHNIVESISDKLKKEIIFEILCKTYFDYKRELQIKKELVVYKKFVSENNIKLKCKEESNKTNSEKKNLEIEDNNIIKSNKKNYQEQSNDLDKSDKKKEKEFEFNIEFKEFKNDLLQDKAQLSDKSNSENNNLQEIENSSKRDSVISESNISKEEKSNNNIDDSTQNKKRDKRQFEYIKELEEYKDLLKKENKIRKDFHGNRDFYNLIKGIAIEHARIGGDSNDNDKVSIIVKYI